MYNYCIVRFYVATEKNFSFIICFKNCKHEALHETNYTTTEVHKVVACTYAVISNKWLAAAAGVI